MPPGALIGHEFVSEVVEVGAEVDDPTIVPGLRVFVNPTTSLPLGDGVSLLEISGSVGGLSQYVTVHNAAIGYNLHPLPDNVSYDQAVVIEPFSVANHAVNAAKPKPGEKALVFGAGAVGLGVLANLKAKGVEEVIVSDIVPNKLEVVKKLGGIPINGQEVDPIDSAAEKFGTVENFSGEDRADIDIYVDTSGAPNSV